MGKDLGKIAGSLKAEAATFSEAMNESLAEAEKVRGQADRLPVSLSPCLLQPSRPVTQSPFVSLSPLALSSALPRAALLSLCLIVSCLRPCRVVAW